MKTFDHAARARIARGWASSSLDQATYAAQHGISTRTLRDWVRRHHAGRRPQAQIRAAIVASIEQLQNALAALDAEAAGDAEAAANGTLHVLEQHAERHAVPAEPPMPAPSVSPDPDAAALTPTTAQDAAGRRPGAAAPGVDEATRCVQEKGSGTIDLEALRKRARQLREARAASGAPRRNTFLDWDSE